MTLVLDFSMQQIDNHAIGLLKILHPVTKIPTSVSKEIQVVKLVACQAKSTTNIQAIYLFPYSSNSIHDGVVWSYYCVNFLCGKAVTSYASDHACCRVFNVTQISGCVYCTSHKVQTHVQIMATKFNTYIQFNSYRLYCIRYNTIKVLYTFIMFAYHTFDIIPHTMLSLMDTITIDHI